VPYVSLSYAHNWLEDDKGNEGGKRWEEHKPEVSCLYMLLYCYNLNIYLFRLEMNGVKMIIILELMSRDVCGIYEIVVQEIFVMYGASAIS
jgi:hypothetical protein